MTRDRIFYHMNNSTSPFKKGDTVFLFPNSVLPEDLKPFIGIPARIDNFVFVQGDLHSVHLLFPEEETGPHTLIVPRLCPIECISLAEKEEPDLYTKLRGAGLTSSQCQEVIEIIDSLPIQVVGLSGVKVSIPEGPIRVEPNEPP